MRATSLSDPESTGTTLMLGRASRMSPVIWRTNCGIRLKVCTGRFSFSRKVTASAGH